MHCDSFPIIRTSLHWWRLSETWVMIWWCICSDWSCEKTTLRREKWKDNYVVCIEMVGKMTLKEQKWSRNYIACGHSKYCLESRWTAHSFAELLNSRKLSACVHMIQCKKCYYNMLGAGHNLEFKVWWCFFTFHKLSIWPQRAKKHACPNTWIVKSPAERKQRMWSNPTSEPAPICTPCTGSSLWLSCGWASTELMKPMLVAHFVRSRFYI